jgi:hypothetical protein
MLDDMSVHPAKEEGGREPWADASRGGREEPLADILDHSARAGNRIPLAAGVASWPARAGGDAEPVESGASSNAAMPTSGRMFSGGRDAADF